MVALLRRSPEGIHHVRRQRSHDGRIREDAAAPKFASNDNWKPTADEALAAYRGFVAYFGTYTVDAKAHAVTHHVEGSLNPGFFGTDQVRPAALEGERLILSDGKTFRVVWERVR